MTGVIEAQEGRQIIILDISNVFIQTYLENSDKRIILILRGATVEILLRLVPKVYKEFVEIVKNKKYYI